MLTDIIKCRFLDSIQRNEREIQQQRKKNEEEEVENFKKTSKKISKTSKTTTLPLPIFSASVVGGHEKTAVAPVIKGITAVLLSVY